MNVKKNKQIEKRFEELEQKAIEILENKIFGYHDIQNVAHYEVDTAAFKGWATSVLNLLQGVFGENSIHYQNFYEQYQNQRRINETFFRDCKGVFEAAREDYEGGYLFNIRGLIQAEVFDDVLEQAKELLQAGYKDASCVVVGVALETTLRELCTREGISHNKLDRMNADLSKAGVYNMVMQKQVTAWAERRNKAAHGDWSAYNEADVEDMISGVTRLIAEYL